MRPVGLNTYNLFQAPNEKMKSSNCWIGDNSLPITNTKWSMSSLTITFLCWHFVICDTLLKVDCKMCDVYILEIKYKFDIQAKCDTNNSSSWKHASANMQGELRLSW